MKNSATLALMLAALSAAQTAPEAKEQPPAGSAPRAFAIPARQTFTLPNGLKVSLVPYGNVPKVFIQAVVRVGNVNESANQVWLADLTAAMMREGAGARDARQMAETTAGMGGQLNVGAGEDETRVTLDVLSEFAPEAIALVADALQRPLLPENELPRIKKNLLRRLAVGRSTPQALADEAFRKVIYGDHPYGRVFPSEAMLQGYTLDDVKKFHAANFGAARTHLYVVGKLPADLRKTVTAAFGAWAKGPDPAIVPAQPSSRRSVTLLDRPNAPQSTLRVGIPVLNPADPNYVPMAVTNSLLGGSFGSRITSNIRENKGYTYSPFSMISSRYRDAFWVENADVTTAVTGASLREIFAEIDRMRKEAPGAAELKGIQNYLGGMFVLRNSSRDGIAGQLSFVDLHGLGDAYVRDYVKKVHAVTGADVQAMTEKYLNPEKMAIVVVGDKAKVAEQLQPYQPK